jgi:hypothetical protein
MSRISELFNRCKCETLYTLPSKGGNYNIEVAASGIPQIAEVK